MKDEVKKKEETESIWVVGQMPATWQPALVNKETQQTEDIYEALASIKNTLEYLKKKI